MSCEAFECANEQLQWLKGESIWTQNHDNEIDYGWVTDYQDSVSVPQWLYELTEPSFDEAFQ